MSKKLGDIANITKLAGFEHTTYIQGNCTHSKDKDSDLPLFIGRTVKDGKIDCNFDWYISENISNSLPRSQLRKKCIVLPYVGSVGDLAVFDGSYNAHLGSNIAKIELKEKCGYLEEFLYYYLKSPFGQKLLLRDIQGAVQKNITMEAIRNIELPDICIEKQKDMINVLRCIDNKINLNNKINAELESMAKTLYDYWFLQFEFPNKEGKPYKSSGGKMVWNEELKREIPDGWKDGIIGDLGEIIAGGTPSTKNEDYYTEDGIAWITPNDLSNTDNKYISHGERDITEVGLKNSSAKLMPRGTVLLTSRAPIGYIGVAANEICTNQGFKSIVPYKKYGTEFVYYTIKTMIPYIKLVGSGSTFTEVSKEVVEKIKIVLPDTNIILKYNSSIEYMAQYREKLEKENKELTELRDFMLPLLMNGQVGFKE